MILQEETFLYKTEKLKFMKTFFPLKWENTYVYKKQFVS